MSISLNKFKAVLTIAKLFNKEDKLTHCIEEIDKINSIADVSHYVEEMKKQIINEENKKQNEETNLLCLNSEPISYTKNIFIPVSLDVPNLKKLKKQSYIRLVLTILLNIFLIIFFSLIVLFVILSNKTIPNRKEGETIITKNETLNIQINVEIEGVSKTNYTLKGDILGIVISILLPILFSKSHFFFVGKIITTIIESIGACYMCYYYTLGYKKGIYKYISDQTTYLIKIKKDLIYFLLIKIMIFLYGIISNNMKRYEIINVLTYYSSNCLYKIFLFFGFYLFSLNKIDIMIIK